MTLEGCGGNESSLGAAPGGSAGRCFHQDVYDLRLFEPRSCAGLFTCASGPPTVKANPERGAGEGPR